MKTKFASFTSDYSSDIAIGQNDPTSDFDWISLRQAFGCFISKTEPMHEAVRRTVGYEQLPETGSKAAIDFILAAQQKKFNVIGRFCIVTLSPNLMNHSPRKTCDDLRRSNLPIYTKDQVYGAFHFPLHCWQPDGVIWEQNLLLQYEWEGKLCDDLPEAYERVTESWKKANEQQTKFVAFCDVGVEISSFNNFLFPRAERPRVFTIAEHQIEHRRLLLAMQELELGFGSLNSNEIARAHANSRTRTGETWFNTRTQELQNLIERNNSSLMALVNTEMKSSTNVVRKSNSNAGRPKRFNYEAIFDWLQKRMPQIDVQILPQLHGIVTDEFFDGRQGPGIDILIRNIKKLPNGREWLADHVEKMRH
jgi:hypothetical protein